MECKMCSYEFLYPCGCSKHGLCLHSIKLLEGVRLLDTIVILMVVFFGYIMIPMFLMLALPISFCVLQIYFAHKKLLNEDFFLLYPFMLVNPILFLIGLTLNILAIPVTLSFGPFVFGYTWYKKYFELQLK